MADFTPTAVANSSNFVSGTGDTTSDVLTDLLDNRTEIYGLVSDVAEQFYGATPPASPNAGTLWRCSTTGGSYVANTTYRWSGTAWSVDLATALVVGARNAVLQGHVDTSGNPALFTGSTAALTAQLNATTTPLVITWMDGNDAISGEKNKIGTVSTNSATFWSSLPQSSTVYLYIEIDGSTIQGGYSTSAPAIQTYEPTHAAGLDWVNFNTGEVYNSNGSAWSKKYRVYVGTATTDTTKVIGVTIYPYVKDYQSQIDAIIAYSWTEKFILNKPADTYVSPSLPPSRNGTMATMDFYCTGTPASSTNIVVKQGSATVGTAAISAAGKTTLTFSTAVTGALDDLFTYTVGGAGLAACTVLCNQKWGNR